MDSVTLKDFRCFRGEQTARMAPLTLLVGENSTGKTSFLAILRALWDVAVYEEVPDFRREPYDLGAFSEIVYNDSSRGEQADAFQAGFRDSRLGDSDKALSFRFTFQDVDGVTFPVSRYASVGDTSFEAVTLPDQNGELRLGIEHRVWKVDSEVGRFRSSSEWLRPIGSAVRGALHMIDESVSRDSVRETAGQYEELSLNEDDVGRIRSSHQELATWQFDRMLYLGADSAALFAGAPVRSKPRRTYDPSRLIPDPEGRVRPYVPRQYVSSRLGRVGQPEERPCEVWA